MISLNKSLGYSIPLDLVDTMLDAPKHYLLTGSAGFIGSNILEVLLTLNQKVTSIDNFSTGKRENLEYVRVSVGEEKWANHKFIEGDITNIDICKNACINIDVVLHQAALGSVPRSLADPISTHESNATGFLNIITSAKDANVKKFIYAASSSTYGDSIILPKEESVIGSPLSPYAVTKYLNELYAGVYSSCYGLNVIGLRYFNVFGPRQDPDGAYAAVIPKWIGKMLSGDQCIINGDGTTTRDFCFIANAVQANLRASVATNKMALNQVYNVACGNQTSLVELHKIILRNLKKMKNDILIHEPIFSEFRQGDIKHSLASIKKAQKYLNYSDLYNIDLGLEITCNWFVNSKR